MSHTERLARARVRMEELGVDLLLLSIGADLPYLTGYEATPLERLTMLVLPRTGDARLVVPRLEVARVDPRPDLFEIVAWEDADDPVALVARLAGSPSVVAVGDQTWARFVLALQEALPGAVFTNGSAVTAALRAVKDAQELDALGRAAAAVDAVAEEMRVRPFAGRTETDLQRELVERMRAAGHQAANFAIVAAGENAASPHHEPGARVVGDGDVVLCDFGGRLDGYCSDITRMFHVGEPDVVVRDAYAVLAEVQEQGVRAAIVGAACEHVDAVARRALSQAGFGEAFVHRLGHGIGREPHEEPYLVAGNSLPLAAGHVFSIEPGIYLTGRFGLRLEDIVVATADGPHRLNAAPRDMAIVA